MLHGVRPRGVVRGRVAQVLRRAARSQSSRARSRTSSSRGAFRLPERYPETGPHHSAARVAPAELVADAFDKRGARDAVERVFWVGGAFEAERGFHVMRGDAPLPMTFFKWLSLNADGRR